jgi:diguanylate cyclase (GGDEF)-like protein
MAIPELQPNPPDLPEEIRGELQQMQRRTPWETGLAVALGMALVGMVFSAAASRWEFRAHVDLSGPIFFAVLAGLLLVAWLVQERSKRAHANHYQTVAEVLHRHLRSEQAMRDPLTSAYNRAALQEFSARYLRRAERGGEPLALALFDLDNFHDLNNKYGHIAGDLALAEFVHVLQSSTRGSDVVARYGGDEFVVLLAETPRGGADIVVRRVEERLAKRNKQVTEGQIPFTASSGTGTFEKGMDFERLFQAADLDLLRRKAERRGTRVPAGRD